MFEQLLNSQEIKKLPRTIKKNPPNQSQKLKHTTNYLKYIPTLNLTEYFSLQKSCNKTNESYDKYHKNNQVEKDKQMFPL